MTVIDLYFRKYDRIYNPSANAVAVEQKNAQIARRIRFEALFRPKVVDLD